MEELEAARSSDLASYAQILFQRLFHTEIAHLIEHNTLRIDTEIPAEEKEEIRQFCSKLNPLDFATLKDHVS